MSLVVVHIKNTPINYLSLWSMFSQQGFDLDIVMLSLFLHEAEQNATRLYAGKPTPRRD
jgi:hypothetical protein